MNAEVKSPADHIVPAPSRALIARTAAIVSRGLRDLARDSNWLVRKVFAGKSDRIAVSPDGQVCGFFGSGAQTTEHLWICYAESTASQAVLTIPREPTLPAAGLPARFSFSPTARRLVVAWEGWPKQFHVFDLQARGFLGAFGGFESAPEAMAWSERGTYFAAAVREADESRLKLWRTPREPQTGMPFGDAAETELRSSEQLEGLAAGGDGNDADGGELAGFGSMAFRPDDRVLAAVACMEGEWADDAILLLDVPGLKHRETIHAQGRVTSLGWAHAGGYLTFCAAGQCYRIAKGSAEPETLPFGAEICACHPHLPLCLGFSSWLKNSAKGRLFVADVKSLTIVDECAAEGVVDLRWSVDGSKAYAVTSDGLAYIYDPPLL